MGIEFSVLTSRHTVVFSILEFFMNLTPSAPFKCTFGLLRVLTFKKKSFEFIYSPDQRENIQYLFNQKIIFFYNSLYGMKKNVLNP